MRGATPIHCSLVEAMIEFQSTLPMRGATLRIGEALALTWISIHAPHAGSDHKKRHLISKTPLFQSTLPMRGATHWVVDLNQL